MRAGDQCKHKPSGETWVVGFHERGYVCALGWPLALVPEAECELSKACTDEEHEKTLREMSDGERADARTTHAVAALAALDAKEG